LGLPSTAPFRRPFSTTWQPFGDQECPGGKLKLFVFAALPAIDAARTPDELKAIAAQRKQSALPVGSR
jgi:hypothetical protein